MNKIFLPKKISLFAYNRFSVVFISIKMAESEKIVLVRCVIDFDNRHVSLRLFSLSLKACKVMTVFFKFWPEKYQEVFHFKLRNQVWC